MIHSPASCRCRGYSIAAFYMLIFFCIFKESDAQSFYTNVTDSVAYFKLSDTHKATDTIYFSLSVNKVSKDYKLKSTFGVVQFIEDADEGIKRDLGNTSFRMSADSLHRLMQANGVVVLQRKMESPPMTYLARLVANIDLAIIAFLLGLLLAIPILFFLFKRKKTISNPENETAMEQKKFIQSVTVPLEMDAVLKGRNALDEILRKIYSMQEKLQTSEKQNEMLAQEKSEYERKLIDCEAANNDLLNELRQAEGQLSVSSLFNQGMYDKYIQEFNKYFSSASPMHPIPLEMKTMFTQTVYALAFHYLSYNNAFRKSASADDELNVNVATGKSNERGREKVSLQDELNIQKLSGLIIHIAEELKKNGVSSLSDVNFRGYYFKD